MRQEAKGRHPPDALDVALVVLDRMSPGGRTEKWSLNYKCKECRLHMVPGERQMVRYFLC